MMCYILLYILDWGSSHFFELYFIYTVFLAFLLLKFVASYFQQEPGTENGCEFLGIVYNQKQNDLAFLLDAAFVIVLC